MDLHLRRGVSIEQCGPHQLWFHDLVEEIFSISTSSPGRFLITAPFERSTSNVPCDSGRIVAVHRLRFQPSDELPYHFYPAHRLVSTSCMVVVRQSVFSNQSWAIVWSKHRCSNILLFAIYPNFNCFRSSIIAADNYA